MHKLLGLSVVFALLISCNSGSKSNTNSSDSDSTEKTVVWDNSYGGVDKAYDTELLELREEMAPKFQTLEFKDSITGRTMTYNLFIPKDYDENKSYPLIQFIADASTVGKGAMAPLKQGYGAIIWATDESQAENPCFILSPAFAGPDWAVNDKHETSEEVAISFRLLNKVVSTYNIDQKRLYTTGQSMGGMISFYLNATYPDFFAASIFVGSQWDVNVLKPLVNQTFCYIVSAGDQKASAGMKELGSMLSDNGVVYGSDVFSAQLPQAEQEQKVEELLSQGHKINFIQFTKGTVVPDGTSERGAPEHMYSFDYAYKLKTVRDWLFQQKKD